MEAVVSVVRRKDASLNRRLYSWLLGEDASAEKQAEYFRTYALNELVYGLRRMFQRETNEMAEATRPYLILISLLDRTEVGGPVSSHLFLDILASLYTHLERTPEWRTGNGLLTTANMFFRMLDPSLIYGIWHRILQNNKEPVPLHLLSFFMESVVKDVGDLHLPHFTILMFDVLEALAVSWH